MDLLEACGRYEDTMREALRTQRPAVAEAAWAAVTVFTEAVLAAHEELERGLRSARYARED
jgi:hypothetical protein